MMSKRLDMTKILLCCAFLLSLSVPLVRSQAAQPPLPGYSVYGQIMNNCGYDASVYVYYYDYNDYEQNFYVDVPSNGYTDILLCNGSLFDCTHGLPSYVYVWSANYTFPNSASPSQSYYIDVPFTVSSPMYSNDVSSVTLQCPPATPTPSGEYSVYARVTNPCPYDASVNIQFTVDGTPYSDQIVLTSGGGYQQFTLCDGTQFYCAGATYNYSVSYTFTSSSTVRYMTTNYTAPNTMNFDAISYTSLTCFSKQALPSKPIKLAKQPSPSPAGKSPSLAPSGKVPSSATPPAPHSGAEGMERHLIIVFFTMVMTWGLMN